MQGELKRRDFMRMVAACGALTPRPAKASLSSRAPGEGRIMTVRGPIPPRALGRCLPHEHVLVDFAGADRITRDRYDANEAYAVALPFLERAHGLGCAAFVECTPAYLGRDPRLLERLARASRLHILTNTGYYGAAKDLYVPKHAHEESAGQLADRWVKEWVEGIEGTGVRPGFIKTGVDAGPLSEIDRKLLQAAARAHLRSGLTIASHTGDTRAAREQLEVLAAEGVAPSAWIWVHAQSDWELAPRVEAARRGAWIEIDNVSPRTVAECVGQASALKQAGMLNRVLVSHDAGWYRPGEPKGGAFRGFDTLYTAFVPALRQSGWTREEIEQLLASNPAAAFAVRVRKP